MKRFSLLALGSALCAMSAFPEGFEVASIKPADPSNRHTQIQISPGGRFVAKGVSVRMLMQQAYEEMFSRLTLQFEPGAPPVSNLRAALRAIARFVRDNRAFLGRVLADALSGEQCARDFLGANLPRHLGVLQALIEAGQKEGSIAAIPVTQALGTCAGALAMPILFGGALVDSGALAAPMAKMIDATLLADAALDQRIELVLAAIAAGARAPSAARKRVGKKAKGKS